ncbi:MAG: thymidylate synthase [Chloroflexota bacterium]|nr:thymidylate synthase [Chloroflexota bacterium]
MFRNSTEALYDGLHLIKNSGKEIKIRENFVREITSHNFSIEKPWEKFIVIPKRFNNIFATIAESIWVLGGRNDIEYLTHYLRRAPDFSDDGKTWRAGYGKRIRHWESKIDQIKEIYNLLSQDRTSRRAVINIFNPSEDFFPSKDIPCNNWLHFLIRDNKLIMNIAIRSNDILWGFSGINSFEWGILQELLANWLGCEIGSSFYFIGSFHLYKNYYQTSDNILHNWRKKTLYDFCIPCVKCKIPFHSFDNELEVWFEKEQLIREGREIPNHFTDGINNDFLKNAMQTAYIYSLIKKETDQKLVSTEIMKLPLSDFRISAFEYFSRKYQTKNTSSLSVEEKEFLEYFWNN